MPGCWVMPRTAATASGTADASPTATELENPHTIWEFIRQLAQRPRAPGAFSPTPPTPVSVTNRRAPPSLEIFAHFLIAADQQPDTARPKITLVSCRRVCRGGKSARQAGDPSSWKNVDRVGGYRVTAVGRGSSSSTPLSEPAVESATRICPPWPAAITRATRLRTVPK